MVRIIFLTCLLALPALAQSPDPARVEAVVAASFASAPADWKARVTQDKLQEICSLTRNQPNAAQSADIIAAAKASIVLPADTAILGNWRNGEKIAQNGQGGQFSDAPGTVSGGNCYACHQMALSEISYGTLGPSLVQYGKLHNFDATAARTTFAKIFNPHVALACSTMPRFGANKVLTAQQISDVVAFLFDPTSPVNADMK
jgi:sulfur-oxidizing protein SoxX